MHTNPTAIILETRRRVTVDALHVTSTYLGLMEGTPKEEEHAEVIVRANESIQKLWGKRRVHLIRPQGWDGHAPLPPWTCMAWLTSDTPMDARFMGSELVVIWFEVAVFDTPINAILQDRLESIAWEKVAEDFDW